MKKEKKTFLNKLGFGGKSRKQVLDEKIDTTTQLQSSHLKIAAENTEINKKIISQNEELKNLVLENKKKENILLQKEDDLKEKENSLEERTKEIRKQEINIEARKSTVKIEESRIRQEDKGLNREREDIKIRERKAKKDVQEAEKTKEKFEKKNTEIQSKEKELKDLEAELKERKKIINQKERKSKKTFERAEKIDEEIKEKEKKFEEKRAEIEQKLKEKIDEYDRKLADIEEIKNTADAVKFDKSEEGKDAKIVVQEAIRQAKKLAEDKAKEFDELQEKYCKGTFSGFATPLNEIDQSFKELKVQMEQIKEHAENSRLTDTVKDWLDKIDDYFLEAEKSKKAWEFSSAYRNIIFGLATCKNYELLLEILNNWGEEQEENTEETEEDYEVNYYEILEVDENATQEEIKKAYKNLAKKYHPDKAKGEKEKKEFNEKMIQINKSYEILSNENKKRNYDEKRKQK